MEAVLSNAVARCPFLHSVAQQEGQAFAERIAINPFVPASGPRPKRPLLEELTEYQCSFKLFHGASGVVPLNIGANQQGSQHGPAPTPCQQGQKPRGPLLPAHAPFAAMSLSFGGGLPDFGHFLRSLQQKQNKASQHKPKAQNGQAGPAEQLRKPHTNLNNSSSSHSAASGGGQCPLRKMLGPMAPLVFNSKGHIQCPEPIVRARAALAATKPVRELRPQALPVKLAAVGAIAAAFNIPCGMWREHTKKFSFQWFVAVHASIPFIAMLRKAVIMPKYAILFTIAAAVAGQAMGAKMERARLQRSSAVVEPVAPKPVAVIAAAKPVVYEAPVQPTPRYTEAAAAATRAPAIMALADLDYSSAAEGLWPEEAGQGLQHGLQLHHAATASMTVSVRS